MMCLAQRFLPRTLIAPLIFFAVEGVGYAQAVPAVVGVPNGYEEVSLAHLSDEDVQELEKFSKESVDDVSQVKGVGGVQTDRWQKRKILKDGFQRIADRSRSFKKGYLVRNVSERVVTLLALIESRVESNLDGKGILDLELEVMDRSLDLELALWGPYSHHADGSPAKAGEDLSGVHYAVFGKTYAGIIWSAADKLHDVPTEYRVRLETLKLLRWDLYRDENRSQSQISDAIQKLSAAIKHEDATLRSGIDDTTEGLKAIKAAYAEALVDLAKPPVVAQAKPEEHTETAEKRATSAPAPTQADAPGDALNSKMAAIRAECSGLAGRPPFSKDQETQVAAFIAQNLINEGAFTEILKVTCNFDQAIAVAQGAHAGQLDLDAFKTAYALASDYTVSTKLASDVRAKTGDVATFGRMHGYTADGACPRTFDVGRAYDVAGAISQKQIDEKTFDEAYRVTCNYDQARAVAQSAHAGQLDFDAFKAAFAIAEDYNISIRLASDVRAKTGDVATFGRMHGYTADGTCPRSFDTGRAYDVASWITQRLIDEKTFDEAFRLTCNYDQAKEVALATHDGKMDFDAFKQAYAKAGDYGIANRLGHDVHAKTGDVATFGRMNGYTADGACPRTFDTGRAYDVASWITQKLIEEKTFDEAYGLTCNYDQAREAAALAHDGKMDFDAFKQAFAEAHDYTVATRLGRDVHAKTGDVATFGRMNGYTADGACPRTFDTGRAYDVASWITQKLIEEKTFDEAYGLTCNYDQAREAAALAHDGKMDFDAFKQAFAEAHDYTVATRLGRDVHAKTGDVATFARMNGYTADGACPRTYSASLAYDVADQITRKAIDESVFTEVYRLTCNRDQALEVAQGVLAHQLDLDAFKHVYAKGQDYGLSKNLARDVQAKHGDVAAFDRMTLLAADKTCPRPFDAAHASVVAGQIIRNQIEESVFVEAYKMTCNYDQAFEVAQVAFAKQLDFGAFKHVFADGRDYNLSEKLARDVQAKRADVAIYDRMNGFTARGACPKALDSARAYQAESQIFLKYVDEASFTDAYAVTCDFSIALSVGQEVHMQQMDLAAFIEIFSLTKNSEVASGIGREVHAKTNDVETFKRINGYNGGCPKAIDAERAHQISVQIHLKGIDEAAFTSTYALSCDYRIAYSVAQGVQVKQMDLAVFKRINGYKGNCTKGIDPEAALSVSRGISQKSLDEESFTALYSQSCNYGFALGFGQQVAAKQQDLGAFEKISQLEGCPKPLNSERIAALSGKVAAHTLNLDGFVEAYSQSCNVDTAITAATVDPVPPPRTKKVK